MKRTFKSWLMLAMSLSLLPSRGHAQQSLIQVTSPANGAVINEGQTITITVSADPSVQVIGVLTDGAFPDLQAGSSSTQFLQQIPTTIRPGIYHLTAIGLNSSGDVESDPVSIDVEPQFVAAAVDPKPNVVSFTKIGNTMPIAAIGTFSDGTTLDITHSSMTSFSSGNTQVATVDGNGIVTATGPGVTTILITTGQAPLYLTYGAVYVKVSPAPATGTAPVITNVTPTSGVPGTTQVTISGSNFGQTQGTGFVQLGTQNGIVSAWTDSQIVATVPTGSAPGVAEVGQNGLQSNDVPFGISAPVIQGISPISVVPGMQMNITGSGFGAIQGSAGLVLIGNQQGIVTSWSDNQISATVPSGTRQGSVYVYQGGLYSNPVTFTRIPPTITSISPTSVIPGMQMTISGTGFENAQYTGFVVTGNEQAAVQSWSDTQIVVTIPAGMREGSVYMQQGAVWSNSIPFTRIPPSITSISPTSVIPGTQMTITGTGFENAQYTGFVVTGNEQAPVQSWSDTQIVVTIPAGMREGSVYMQQGAEWSNSVPFTRIPPTITSISPTSVIPGMQMTIAGTGFESAQYTGFVVTGNEQAPVVSWSDTQIVVTIPAGMREGSVYMQQGAVWSNSIPFTRIPPSITSISPTSVIPGTQMTITGTGFENAQYTGFVIIGNQQASVLSWSDTQIVATVPSVSQGGSVYMQQGAVWSNSVPFGTTGIALVSISITPATATTFNNGTVQYSALGTYSDGSTRDLTSTVVWSSSDTSKVTIGNGSASPGLAVAGGEAIGNVTIGATFGTVTANAVLTIQFND